MDRLDVDELISRFAERAGAVKDRPLPPVAGDDRTRLVKRAELDFMDYSLIAAAQWAVEDGKLVLRIPLG